MKKYAILGLLALFGLGALAAVDTYVIPNATIFFGKNTTADKRLNFNNNAGVGNPAIRMHLGVLEFSNDGVIFFPISSGVPAGFIGATSSTAVPSTWYATDGSSKTAAGDLPLFSAIHTNYGSTDGVHPTGILVGTATVSVSSCAGVTAGFYIVEDAGFVPLGTTVVSCITTTLIMSAPATNSTTEPLTIAGHFNVPKGQGLTLRGWDPTGINDPDVGTRTANNPGGNVTTGLGSQQADAFQNHVHSIVAQTAVVYSGGGFTSPGGSQNTTMNTQGAVSGNVSSETRGKNLSVNWIIKR